MRCSMSHTFAPMVVSGICLKSRCRPRDGARVVFRIGPGTYMAYPIYGSAITQSQGNALVGCADDHRALGRYCGTPHISRSLRNLATRSKLAGSSSSMASVHTQPRRRTMERASAHKYSKNLSAFLCTVRYCPNLIRTVPTVLPD